MNVELKILDLAHLQQFKRDMQEAFQQGAIDEFGETEEQILPESHIDRSLNTAGAVAYEAVYGGETLGGAIVIIDEKTQRNHLDFLYVKKGAQSKGLGLAMWREIERKHPLTEIWETATPYFEKRNIHFYINKCGFHAVEFYNKRHKDPNDTEELPDIPYFDGMFRFEKVMK